MAYIMIIDDDPLICRTLSRYIRNMGHDVHSSLTLEEGLKDLSSRPCDVLLLDVRLPDGNGLEALSDIRQLSSAPEVIIITGKGDPDGAEAAIKSGAWAYLEKPPRMEDLKLQLIRTLEYRKERVESRQPVVLKRDNIIGNSPELEACFEFVAKVANSHMNILLTGETGTGKELFCQGDTQEQSPRLKKLRSG